MPECGNAPRATRAQFVETKNRVTGNSKPGGTAWSNRTDATAAPWTQDVTRVAEAGRELTLTGDERVDPYQLSLERVLR